MSTPDPVRAPETDERFPSGPWFGYYHQWGIQARQRLRLEFAGGTVSGGGRDPGGDFAVRGVYSVEAGTVSLIKTYAAHRVEYAGQANGDGIGGDWAIRYEHTTDRGIFRIWPDDLAMSEKPRLKAEEPVPAGA